AGIIMSFKQYYQSYFIKWLLDQYKAEKDERMNVFDAIRFIARAWREAFNFSNIMDLEEYIDYPGEKNTHEVLSDKEILDLTTNLESKNENVEDDNSTEMHQTSHQEALNAVNILEQYIMQNDFSKIAQFEHDKALLKLQKKIRKLRIKAFKQTTGRQERGRDRIVFLNLGEPNVEEKMLQEEFEHLSDLQQSESVFFITARSTSDSPSTYEEAIQIQQEVQENRLEFTRQIFIEYKKRIRSLE
ncbi:44028_t:CDS:2, partial [Gigaspora margarita]